MQSVGRGDKMATKRRASDSSDEEPEVPEKRSRRSRSEPRNTGSGNARDEEIQRLLGKLWTQDESEGDGLTGDEDEEECYEDSLLIDAVPEYLDPEQLGFLLCAQETLRFLRQTGTSHRCTTYVCLRSYFLKAIKDLGIA